jgi:hypothetical protein
VSPDSPKYGRRPRSLEEAVWKRVRRDEETGCWEAHGYMKDGYQRVGFNGGKWLIHRLVYEWARGPIADGLVLDHLCRNPPCCNPWHLEAVAQRQNIMRGDHARRARGGRCRKGHDPSELNFTGGRYQCRACAREYQRAKHGWQPRQK